MNVTLHIVYVYYFICVYVTDIFMYVYTYL